MVDGTVAERNVSQPPMYAPIMSRPTCSKGQAFFSHSQESSLLVSSLCVWLWLSKWPTFSAYDIRDDGVAWDTELRMREACIFVRIKFLGSEMSVLVFWVVVEWIVHKAADRLDMDLQKNRQRTAHDHKAFLDYINSSGIKTNPAMGGLKWRRGQGVGHTCPTYPACTVMKGYQFF
jgi:hypothetical protein